MFDDWQQFWDYDIQKSIADLFENEKTIKDLIGMLRLFVLQVVKKDGIIYLLTKLIYETLFFHFFCLFFPSNSFIFYFFFMLLLFLTFCLSIPVQPHKIFEHFI